MGSQTSREIQEWILPSGWLWHLTFRIPVLDPLPHILLLANIVRGKISSFNMTSSAYI
jgi:hypothetical protein